MRYSLLFLLLFTCCVSFAQLTPFAKYGDSSKVLTISNGKFQEVFYYDSIVRIGSVVLNIKQRKVSHFISRDTIQSESSLEPEVVSRWLSPDPLTAKYPFLSPYNYVANNPILYIDSDGKEFDLSNLSESQKQDFHSMIKTLSESDMFRYVYEQMANSSSVFVVNLDANTRGGGSFKPNADKHGGTVNLRSFNGSTPAQELFHGYQYDNVSKQYPNGVSPSDIETEGDLFTYYVEVQLGGSRNVPFGMDNILNPPMEYNEEIPTSQEMGTTEFNQYYQNLKQERFEYWTNEKQNNPDADVPKSYTTTPTNAPPNAIKKVRTETENGGAEVGPRMENGNFYSE